MQVLWSTMFDWSQVSGSNYQTRLLLAFMSHGCTVLARLDQWARATWFFSLPCQSTRRRRGRNTRCLLLRARKGNKNMEQRVGQTEGSLLCHLLPCPAVHTDLPILWLSTQNTSFRVSPSLFQTSLVCLYCNRFYLHQTISSSWSLR